MATHSVSIRKTESLMEQIEKMHQRIMDRAFDIFRGDGEIPGRDLENWLKAERELVWKPALELTEKDGEFRVNVAVPGADAKDLQIEVTSEDLLIKAEFNHEHKEEKGEIHTCEFQSGRLFRSVRFPKPIDTEKVKAELKNGMLTITAAVAESAKANEIPVRTASA